MTLYIHIVCIRKQGRFYWEHNVLKLRLDHNNLDKAMEDNPSVIECQHIAWLVASSVGWCQCICTHSVAWRVSSCVQCGPCWLGEEEGGLRPQQRPHGDPARPHNP